jgi:hypothetical protein
VIFALAADSSTDSVPVGALLAARSSHRRAGGNSNAVATNGDLVFDSGDSGHWTDVLLFATALHEIGHTLGLSHVPQDNPTAVMNPTLHLGLPLQPDDIAGISRSTGPPISRLLRTL